MFQVYIISVLDSSSLLIDICYLNFRRSNYYYNIEHEYLNDILINMISLGLQSSAVFPVIL